jgi:[acyl-carrier-protein] S-malonyltransferase
MKVAFCFPGQGSHEVGMGRAFAETSPEASAVYREAGEETGLDLERLCFEGPIEELTETGVQQPALVATSIACLRAVEATGLRPDVVVGHSVGEYSALAACGALSDRDAVGLVRQRGLATAAAATDHPGAMTAIIGLDDAVVEQLCDGIENVWPANYNCPGQLVVSCSESSVDELLERAVAAGARRTIRLRVPGGFHSPLVASAAARLRPALDRVTWREPAVPFLSTVTARVEPIGAIPGLLLEQLTTPVRFTQAVRELVRLGVTHAVEVGPGQVLAGLIRRCERSLSTYSVGDPASLAKLEEVLSAA